MILRGFFLAIGYWLLAIGYWLLAIGDWRLAIGYWLLAIGYWRLAIGDWRLAIGDWLCRQSKLHVGGGRGWSTALSKALGAGAAGAGRFSRIFWSAYRFLVVSLLFISYLPSPCLIFIKVASTFLGYA
jgi:hypothetical protein